MPEPLEISVEPNVIDSSQEILDLIAKIKATVGDRNEAAVNLLFQGSEGCYIAMQWYTTRTYQSEGKPSLTVIPIDLLSQLLSHEGYNSKHNYSSQQPSIIQLDIRRKTHCPIPA